MSQKMKCADAQGNDDEWEWDFGGMWVGRYGTRANR